MNRTWKTAALITGILALLACVWLLPFGLVWLLALSDSSGSENHDALYAGMAWCSAALVFAGGGLTLTINALNSRNGKTSRPLQLPPLWTLLWGLPLALVLGEWLYHSAIGGLFFPPLFAIAAGLPPLAALAWTTHRLNEPSWRQASLAIVLGATFSVVLAVVLEIILPGFFFVLVEGLFELFRSSWRYLLNQLAGGEVSQALSSYGFIFALVEVALFAPLAEEFAKPLFCLPIIRHVETPRKAFLIGAAAGVGFAALENLIYTGAGVKYWSGILILRAIGAGIHPLGAGLVALGWYRWLRQPTAPARFGFLDWLRLYGAAVGIHALWNGGSVLFMALVGANFFGNAPEVDMFGLTTAGVLLALLLVLGAGTLLALPEIVRRLPGLTEQAEGTAEEETRGLPGETRADAQIRPYALFLPEGVPTERAIAIWALICLIIALPLGLAALILRGGPP